jgi:hypothetical protein
VRAFQTDADSSTGDAMSSARPYLISDEADKIVGGSDRELELVGYGKSL